VEARALEAALDAYKPAAPEEAADVRRIRAALRAGDAFSRSAPLHVTASALVVDPASRRVLLRWHETMERWMQVGGHFDPGESDPWEVARREAREETGLGDLALVGTRADGPVHVVIVPVPARRAEPAHEHADLRFVFTTDDPDAARAESTAAPLRWVPLSSASREISEDNLLVFLARTRALFS